MLATPTRGVEGGRDRPETASRVGEQSARMPPGGEGGRRAAAGEAGAADFPERARVPQDGASAARRTPMLQRLGRAIALAGSPPWPRTETREPCASFTALRTPYYGDLHIHTRFSADAYIFGTRVTPQDSYAFARGASIPLADDDEQQTRSTRIDRPLDFAAVTDHAEWFGEVRVCDTPGSSVYDSQQCQILRQAEPLDQQFKTTVAWLYTAGIP